MNLDKILKSNIKKFVLSYFLLYLVKYKGLLIVCSNSCINMVIITKNINDEKIVFNF